MNVLITGGTGFIGSNLIKELLKFNFRIFLVINNKTYQGELSDKIKILSGSYPNIKESDLRDIDLIIHLAAYSANPPYDNLDSCIKYNYTQPRHLFELAKKCGVKKYLVFGSCFEYGLSSKEFDYIPTSAKLKPINSYAISKVMFYNWLNSEFSDITHSILYLRLFHIYGDGELETRLWPTLLNKVENESDFDLTFGEQIRDFLNVHELVPIIINEIDFVNNVIGFKVKNLGSGNPMKIKEFVEFWWKKFGAKGKLNFGKLPYREDELMRIIPQLD